MRHFQKPFNVFKGHGGHQGGPGGTRQGLLSAFGPSWFPPSSLNLLDFKGFKETGGNQEGPGRSLYQPFKSLLRDSREMKGTRGDQGEPGRAFYDSL